MPKEMKYALIIFDGKSIGRAEKVYFPKVRRTAREVECNGSVKFVEDD